MDYSKAIEFNPEYAEAYNNLGLILVGLGDKTKACLDYKRACELGECDYYNAAKITGYCE